MKRFIILATMALALVATNSKAALTYYNGHGYEVVYAPGITWADAQAAAALAGGYLATLTTAGEDAFVKGLNAGLGENWLGGYQAAGELVANVGWTWDVTGESWLYTNWNGGEPNDNYGPGSEQHLAIGLGVDGNWNDEGNLANLNGYVLEVPVPEPSTYLAGALLALVFGVQGFRSLRSRKQTA